MVKKGNEINAFEIKGQWFLPSDKETTYSGILTYHPSNGASLEIFGSFSSKVSIIEEDEHETLWGISSDCKQITLCGCFITNSQKTLVSNKDELGTPLTTYSINYILVGLYTSNYDDVEFNKIKCEIFNLDEWIGISGFKPHLPRPEQYPVKEINVNYKILDPIEFIIDDSTTGKFNFIVQYSPLSRYQREILIEQKVELEVKSKSKKKIKDLVKDVTKFQDLLVLALYRGTYMFNIRLNNGQYEKDIELYFSTYSYKENLEPHFNLQMIFHYKQIENNFQNIIRNWYEKYNLLEPAFLLVFEQFYNSKRFDENKFLNLAQAAETFHSRTHNHTKVSKEEYKKMKKELLKTAHPEYHIWLNEQFHFGNSLNLHTRLREIVDKYSNEIVDEIIADKELFVSQVKHSRNYYTHYSKDLKRKALTGANLLYLSEKLKALLVCAFLEEIGIGKNELVNSLDRIKWNLFGHFVEW